MKRTTRRIEVGKIPELRGAFSREKIEDPSEELKT
jgi:hypothetical protein